MKLLLSIAITLLALGCNERTYTLSGEAMMKPEACAECHRSHYDEWRGSMHAYASEDPVFIAMNQRGQRETNGALGDFCVRCHAPLAVALGETTDGLNLKELPSHLQGVNCYFCHNVQEVAGTHNNPLVLANDNVMRGGISNPMRTKAHASAYSPHLDGDNLASADLCGSCHDIVTPKGVHIERTFAEWKETLYSKEDTQPFLTCTACHFEGINEVVASVPNAPIRRRHRHGAPGVDLALTDFPFAAEQREEVQAALDSTLSAELCVYPDGSGANVVVTLENIGAGHRWPSGSTPDRRAWVQVVARKEGAVLFESGVVPEGEALSSQDDPTLWIFRDWLLDAEGEEVSMFWEAESYRSQLLPGPTALSPLDPTYLETHVVRYYPVEGGIPDEVSIEVRIRPVGLDLIDDLIESGDLDPKFRARIPTLTLGSTQLTWRESDDVPCVPR